MNKENAYSNISFCRYLMKKIMDIKSSVYKRSIDSDNVILDDNKSDKIGVKTLRDCCRAESIINNASELCFLSHANDKDHDLYNTISLILEYRALDAASGEDYELIMSYARIKAFMDNAYNKWHVPDKYFETSIAEIEVDESLACKALEDLLENVSQDTKEEEDKMIESSMPATKNPPKPREESVTHEVNVEFTAKPINNSEIDKEANRLLEELREWI